MILVKNLDKYFDDRHVLKNINCRIKSGEKVAIIGPSGAGKSTFLRCLNRLEDIDDGFIFYDNIDITDKNTDINKIRQKMNMVFQYFNLFENKTVLQNITLAPMKLKNIKKEQAEKVAMSLLKTVGLEDKKDCFPRELSGGQKQRIAIVRALAMHPQVILFDEPTSSLDPEMVSEVVNVIEDLKIMGITLIFVTHEISFAKSVADRVIFMCDGEIVCDDSVDAIFNNNENERLCNFLNSFKN